MMVAFSVAAEGVVLGALNARELERAEARRKAKIEAFQGAFEDSAGHVRVHYAKAKVGFVCGLLQDPHKARTQVQVLVVDSKGRARCAVDALLVDFCTCSVKE
jgi:hypothetical protein